MKKGNKTKFYKYENKYQGVHYFQVKGNNQKVVKLTVKQPPMKRGRAYCVGITFIQYVSFIGNYGHNIDDNKWITEITRKEFSHQYLKLNNRFVNAIT